MAVVSGSAPEGAREDGSPVGGGGGDPAGPAGPPLSHGHTRAISRGGACQEQACEGGSAWGAAGQEESRETRGWRRPSERAGHPF